MGRFTGRRRPEETATLPGLQGVAASLGGASGPFTSQDKAEFHHADPETQRWLLRLDAEEVQLLRCAARYVYWAQMAAKWAWRLWWCFTAGLAAALTAGENLLKLPGMISHVVSALKGLFS